MNFYLALESREYSHNDVGWIQETKKSTSITKGEFNTHRQASNSNKHGY